MYKYIRVYAQPSFRLYLHLLWAPVRWVSAVRTRRGPTTADSKYRQHPAAVFDLLGVTSYARDDVILTD